MNFELDEEQRVIAATAAEVLGGADPTTAWQALAKAGLLAPTPPSWMDGDDPGVLEKAGLLAQGGRPAAPGPAPATTPAWGGWRRAAGRGRDLGGGGGWGGGGGAGGGGRGGGGGGGGGGRPARPPPGPPPPPGRWGGPRGHRGPAPSMIVASAGPSAASRP